MLPPFLGTLLFVATAGSAALALLVALVAGLSGNRTFSVRALLAGGSVASLYAVFWILGLALARKTVLAPGQSVSFCGLDCHLHVSVDGVKSGPDLGVTVRFSSNAVQAPEWPRELRFRLIDASGKEYSPSNEVPAKELRAGESWTHELHFPAEAAPGGANLQVTWKPGLDYFVPGAGNILVQRKRQLALPSPGGRGA